MPARPVVSWPTPCMQAWNEDPLDTLKLIAHLRDVRDGKAEQKAFRLCVRWLYEKHPLTLIENLPEIVKVCCVTNLLHQVAS